MKIVELFPLRSTFFYVHESACDTNDLDTLAADHLHLLAYEQTDEGRIIRYWWVASAMFLDGFHESLFERPHRRVDPRTIKPDAKSRDYVLSGQTWNPPAAGRLSCLRAWSEPTSRA